MTDRKRGEALKKVAASFDSSYDTFFGAYQRGISK